MSLTYGPQAMQRSFNAVTLTAAYAGNLATLEVEGLSEVVLFVTYTTGAAETDNSIQIRLEFAPDAITVTPATWYQDVTTTAAAGTVTVSQSNYTFVGAAAATAYTLRILVPVADRQMRIGIQETGVAANFGTCTMFVLKSGRS